MQIRRAGSADLQPLARLWAQSFPGRRTVSDRVAQLEAGIPYGGLETSWLLEERGRLAGAFRAYRLNQYLDGSLVPMLGLAAVATSPTSRRRGVGHEICRAAIRVGRERGDLVSVLYPFRPSFYHALGWGIAGELEAYRFAPKALPVYDEARGVRAAESPDYEALAATYARVATRSNGLIERDSGVWAYHLSRPDHYPFVYEANGVSGYLLAQFGSGRAPGAGHLTIHELVAEDDDAYRGLLGWIALQGDQFGVVHYYARPDESFERRLSDPRPPQFRPARSLWYPTYRQIRGPMLRILDLPGLVSARARWGEESGTAFTCHLEVDDPEVPENRGPWTLVLESGRAHLRAGGDPRTADAQLSTDIATLSEILVGTTSSTEAARLGIAKVGGSAAVLDQIFAPSRPFWLLDEF